MLFCNLVSACFFVLVYYIPAVDVNHFGHNLEALYFADGWALDEIRYQLDCSRWYNIENTRFFIFDLGRYPLYHLTYAPAKFEVAMSNVQD